MDLSNLILFAQEQNASDVHLTSEIPLWLRCRGELRSFNQYVFNPEQLKRLFIPLLSTQQQEKFTAEHCVDFSHQLENGIRLRINLFQQRQGLSAVIRIITSFISTLSELPAPKIFYELIKESHGLLLVTGPTGSGKSTTLAALVAEINKNSAKHIVTLEDPIEFIHSNQKSLMTQRERYTHFSDYTCALRSTLREDPDIILIGEIRDSETMQMALTAAETGHLVLGTLHTATAASSIHRIIDMFQAAQQHTVRNLLADSLVAVISQKLIVCENKRHAVFEVLRATNAVRQLIRDQNISQLITAMQTGSAVGMQTFL